MAGFTSLNTAVSGMNAAQAGLYVTGHNMSNSEVWGYSRQRVVTSESQSQTIGYGNGVLQIGLGADINGIEQIRSKYLDMAYREEVSRLGFHTTKYSTGNEIEVIMGELQSDYEAQSVMQDVWDAVNEMIIDPTGLDTRGNFISTAGSFINKVDNIYTRLLNEQNELNTEVTDMVGDINDYVNQIKNLNQLIYDAESAGDTANDYRDDRNRYIDELSTMLDLTVKVDPSNGMVNLSTGSHEILKSQAVSHIGLRYTADGYPYVEPVFTSSEEILSYAPETEEYQNTEALFDLTGTISATKGNDKGQLKALLVSRGTKPLTYAGMPKKPTPQSLPNISGITKPTPPAPLSSTATAAEIAAYNTAKAQYDTDIAAYNTNPTIVDYNTKLRANTIAEKEYQKDYFNATEATIPTFMREVDTLVNGLVRLINDTFSPLAADDGDPNTADNGLDPGAVLDANTDYKLAADAPYGLDKSRGTEIITRKNLDRFDASGNYIQEESDDYNTMYTMGNIQVNEIFSNPSNYDMIAHSASGDASDTTVLLDMLNTWKTDFISFDGSEKMSVENFYKTAMVKLATDNSDAKSYTDAQSIQVEQADNKRMELSSVSLDEEMTNMMKYQHAYNAASRIFNVIDSMLDTIVNRMGA